jgi:hypothetical protein
MPIKSAAAATQRLASVSAHTLRQGFIRDLVTAEADVCSAAQLSGSSIAKIERHCGRFRAEHALAHSRNMLRSCAGSWLILNKPDRRST